MKYLLFILILSSFILQYSFAQIEQSYFYETNSSVFPFEIEQTSDKGYIVTGREDQATPFVLKVDSLFQIKEFLYLPNEWIIQDPFSKNLIVLSDTSFLMTATTVDDIDGHRNISLIEINHDGYVIQKKALDIGTDMISTNILRLPDQKIIVTAKGIENHLIVLDSVLNVSDIISFEYPDPSFRLKKTFSIHDSLLLIAGTSEDKMFFSTVDSEWQVLKTIEFNLSKWVIGDVDIYVEHDSIYAIYQSDYNFCTFLTMDDTLGISNTYQYTFQPNEFNFINRIGFVHVDSSRFIFYTGNNLFETSREHHLIEVEGNHGSFIDFFISDSTTLILYKNGFLPVSVNKQISGNEFVILEGNSLDSILHTEAENYCIYPSFITYDPVPIELSFTQGTITTNTLSEFTFDTLLKFENRDIDLLYSCPDAPSSTQNITEQKISIYPNPSVDKFNLIAEYPINVIEIYSMNGQQILSHKSTSKEVQISLPSVTQGIYFVRILSQNQWTMHKIVMGF